MIYLTYEEPKTTMNKYGLLIRDRWRHTAPSRFQELEDPDSFFTELGEFVSTQVQATADILAGPSPKDEPYLDRVGRLMSANRQAEELVLAELDWPPIEPEDERAEWESTTMRQEALAKWAWSLNGEWPTEDDFQIQGERWMVPVEFMKQLVEAPDPWTFLREHSETLAASRDRRFQRYLAQGREE